MHYHCCLILISQNPWNLRPGKNFGNHFFQFLHFTDEETDVSGPQATGPKPHIKLVTNHLPPNL